MAAECKPNSKSCWQYLKSANFNILLFLGLYFWPLWTFGTEYAIKGSVVDYFSQQPLIEASVRFITIVDTLQLTTDNTGEFLGTITNIENNPVLLNQHLLTQNFPNPFNPSTTIQFGMDYDVIEVYSVLGQLVGRANVDEVSDLNLNLATGLYIYRMIDVDKQKFVQKKMILLDGGYVTLHLEKINGVTTDERIHIKRVSDVLDEFSRVSVQKSGYASLDTMVNLAEGETNYFKFKLKRKQHLYTFNGAVTDSATSDNLNKLVVFLRSGFAPDTVQAVNGWYENIITDTASSLDLEIKVLGGDLHYDKSVQLVNVFSGTTRTDFDLRAIPATYTIAGKVSNIDGSQWLQDTLKVIIDGTTYQQLTGLDGSFNIDVQGHAANSDVELQFDTPGWTTKTLVVVDPRYVMTDPNSEVSYGVLGAPVTAKLARLDSIPSLRIEAIHDSLMNDTNFCEHVSPVEKMTGADWTWYNFTTDPSGAPVSQAKIDHQNYVIDYLMGRLDKPNGVRYYNATKVVGPAHTVGPQSAVVLQDENALGPGNNRYPSGGPVTEFFAVTKISDPFGAVFAEGVGMFMYDANGSNGDLITYVGNNPNNPILNGRGEKVEATYFALPNGANLLIPNSSSD